MIVGPKAIRLSLLGGSSGSTAWSSITGKPTTLGGYGITDGAQVDSTGFTNSLSKMSVGPTTSVMCLGDSTTAGAGVTDPRQTYPCILSTLGFSLNSSVDYNWGWSGYTTFSINSIYSTNRSITTWTGGTFTPGTVTTSPSATAAAYAVIYAGTNDYFGVYLNATLSTGSNVITGLSRNNYFTDVAGHVRPIAVGDAVTGTGIPLNTVVTVINSSSSVTLSNTPTANATNLLQFTPSPTTSTFHTDLANLITNAHNSGSKVIVCTLPAANNTATPADGVDGQGLFQANRLVYNTYIRGLTIGGGGANPDLIVDLANLPELVAFNTFYYNADLLHPNFFGNQIIARAINNGFLSFITPTLSTTLVGSESIPDTWLSSNVLLLNATSNTLTGNLTIGSGGIGVNDTLTVFSNITINGNAVGTANATFNLNCITGGTSNIQLQGNGTNIWLIKGGTAGSAFSVADSVNSGAFTISTNPKVNGSSLDGSLTLNLGSSSTGSTMTATNFVASGNTLNHATRAYQFNANTPNNDANGAANFRMQLNGVEQGLFGYFCVANTADAGTGASGNIGLKLTTSGTNFVVTDGTNVLLQVTRAGGVLSPVQAPTASAPTYLKGGIYFDTTLNKMRIGGATAWETVTSV